MIDYKGKIEGIWIESGRMSFKNIRAIYSCYAIMEYMSAWLGLCDFIENVMYDEGIGNPAWTDDTYR